MVNYLQERKSITTNTIAKLYQNQEKITMLTCYDASFAALMDQCGVETLLIGDSLGMVCQGLDSTLPVLIEDMVYHTTCVARGNKTALIVTDMPFGTYPDKETAYANAVKLIRAGAHMVKLEGGILIADTIRYLVERSIPVCGHVGLTPQSVNRFGGYRVQGKSENGAAQVMADAKAVAEAGATMMVLEAIPAPLGKAVTEAVGIPTIGIGAGGGTDGQILVVADMLGMTQGFRPRFLRRYADLNTVMTDAIGRYVEDVKNLDFPNEAESY